MFVLSAFVELEKDGAGGIAILPAAPVRTLTRDVEHRYRQDSDFYYLTGFPEPEAVAAEPEPATSEPQVADNEVRLSLEFSGDCWTEISDATGRRLFFEMGRAGDTVSLAGAAPFEVLFGNVDNVAVQVNGSDFQLSSTNPGGRTARMTIMTP